MDAKQLRVKVRDSCKVTLDMDPVTAADLEVGIYNWTITFSDEHSIIKNWKNPRFVSVYRNKATSTIANLDKNSYIQNSRLKERLDENEFMPHEIPFLQRHHMFPDRWKASIDKKLKRDEHVYEERPAAMTNQFKCGKCKKRDCVFQELQLRSCDEPMTLFITCLNCGNRWRIG